MSRVPRGDSIDSRCFAAARTALLVLLMAAPLAFGAVSAWAWTVLTVGACAVLMVWSVGSCTLGVVRIRLSPLCVPMAAALLLLIVQLGAGLTADYIASRESLIKFAGYAVVLILGVQLFADIPDRTWRGFGVATTIYVFATSMFAIIQFLSGPAQVFWSVRPRSGGYIFGPYINHNHYAGLVELLLPLALVTVLLLPARSGVRVLGVFAIAVGIVSVVLCGSRGGTISIMVEMAIFLVLIVRAGRLSVDPAWPQSGVLQAIRFNRWRKAAVAAMGVVILATVALGWLDDGQVWNRWESMADSPELATGKRATIAVDSLRMWWDRAVSGFGAGAFETAYPLYQSWATDNQVDFSHNDYVQVLAETGTIGGLLALASVVIVLRCGFAGLRGPMADDRTSERWQRTGAAIACCGLLVHSLSDFNLHIPANAAWLALLAAWSTGGTWNRRGRTVIGE